MIRGSRVKQGQKGQWIEGTDHAKTCRPHKELMGDIEHN
jgi:hypothetical protein